MKTLEKIEVYSVEPEGFNPLVEVAATYVEINNEILFLQRNASEAGLWGVPAGKLERGESAESAAKRELLEETGISIDPDSPLPFLGKLFIRKPNMDYIFHMFRLSLSKKPTIILSGEHQHSIWSSPHAIEKYPLMQGALEALSHYRNMSRKSDGKANVNAYLILKRKDQVLLHLRQDTGYYDGYYGLVSGHVEAGITITPNQLHFAHCMHRQTNRLNIDLFFECEVYQEEIINAEPEKCAALKFFRTDSLPSNMIDYIADAIKHSANKKFYSEQGWTSQ